MKLKIVLVFLLASLCLNIGLAQTPAHAVTCSHCRFSKDYGKNKQPNPDPSTPRASEECGCVACREITRKEAAARKAEEKQKADALAAKAKAEQEARQRELEEKQAEVLAKRKSSEVLINGANNSATPKPGDQKPAPKETSGQVYMWSNWNTFYDLVTEKELPNTSGVSLIGTHGVMGLKGAANALINGKAYFLHPPRIAVANIGEAGYCNEMRKDVWDLIDDKHNRLFNNDSIHYAEHFFGDWFALFYSPCQTREASREFKLVRLYNVKTKKFSAVSLEQAYTFRLEKTEALYHAGIGRYVFHNRHYISGTYAAEDPNSSYGTSNRAAINHHSFELLLDQLAGGRDGWKAAALLTVSRSSSKGDYYHVALVQDKSDQFVLYDFSKEDYKKYWTN